MIKCQDCNGELITDPIDKNNYVCSKCHTKYLSTQNIIKETIKENKNIKNKQLKKY